jgi:hypothetical protein
MSIMGQCYPLCGEIYWANLEPVEGSEPGSRPVLIVSNNLMNETAKVRSMILWIKDDEPEETLVKSVNLLFYAGQQISKLVNILTE